MDSRRRTLFLLVVLALGALFLSGYFSKSAVSFSLTTDKSTVQVGDTVTATATGSATVYQNMFCNTGTTSNNYCGARGGTGLCLSPCTVVSILDPFNSYGYQGVHFYYNDPVFGEGYVDSSYIYYSAGPDYQHSAVADILVTDGSSSFDGFFVGRGAQLTVSGRISSNLYGPTVFGGWTVGVCYDSSRAAPTIIVDGSPSGFSYFKTVSGSWFGRNWSCDVYRVTGNYTYEDFTIYVTSNADTRLYFTFATGCFYDSTQCPGTISENIRLELSSFSMSFDGYPGFYYFEIQPPSGFSLTSGSTCAVTDGTGTQSYSATYNVTSSASPGTNTFRGIFGTLAYYLFYLYPGSDTYNVSCGIIDTGDPGFLADDTASVTVVTPATNVTLYAYGTNSGSPAQAPDDHFVRGRAYVSGGTAFDRVDLYVDGSLAASIPSSSFTCGSSYCYKDFSIDFTGKSDGSHSLEARLIVNGSLKDTDTKTVYYYQVGVRNVSASQAGNDYVSVSFEYKGGHKSYLIYIDNSSCVVAQNTNFVPASAHDWQTFGPQSFPIPDCARTPGTHTLYVKLSDASGLSATDSTTVNFSFTYSYSVSLDQPVAGTKHLSTDRRGAPPSTYSEPFSISYATDDPNATLKLIVNGSQVQSWTVTGTGSKSGSVPANYLSCGDTQFTAELSGSSGSDQSSVTVHYVCWYASIESPSGSVDVPSADNVTVNEGTTLTLLGITDETPADFPKVVNAYLDGSPLSPVTCPSGYTDCFAVPVGGLACGSTHTLSLEVGDGSTVYSQAQSTITLNCVQRYVQIVSPADGSEFDFNQPLSEVNIDVFVNYAGGDSLSFRLNGEDVSLPESDGVCPYSACYVLPGSLLSLGDNNLEVVLLQSGSPVASDQVTFTVYLWQFIVGEDWGVTPALLYVEEHGSHPDACYVLHDGNLETMVYDDGSARWLFPIDETYVGKTVDVFCSRGSTIVFEQNYTISGPGVQPGAPVVVGGGGTVTVSPQVAFPVFPDRKQAAHYIYSVYHYSGVKPGDNLRDVYISQDNVCVVPRQREPYTITYYKYNFKSFPESDNAVRQILGQLAPDLVVTSVSTDNSRCIPLQGTGVVELAFEDGVYDVLILDVSEAATGINVAALTAILIVGLLIYFMMSRGG